jgi:fused signal recognition particle receptor
MFGFLKDKLKGALGKLTKEVEKDSTTEKKEVIIEKKLPKEEVEKNNKIAEKVVKKDSEIQTKKPQSVEVKKTKTDKTENNKTEVKKIEVQEVIEPKKKGFFQKIFGKKDEEEIIEEKEELRARAEKTLIEPEHKKSIKSEKIIKTEKKIEKEEKIEKPKVEQKVRKVVSQKEEIIEEKEIIVEEITPVIKHVEVEEIETVIVHAPKEEIKQIKPEIKKIEPKSVSEVPKSQPITPKIQPHHQIIEEERSKKVVEQKVEEPKGFFTKITETFTKIQISEEKFEELFWELEVVLLENNVAVEVIDKIKRDLKKELMNGKVSRKGVEELILSTLRQSIIELFNVEKIDFINNIKEKREKGKPYIVAIIGVNGAGKTTSIAKLTHKLQKEGLSVVLAASDTFRAAAIQQLEEHANKLNVKIVKHDYNSDPAAVAFDAIKYAEAKNIDVVMIDTAGRLHSNTNLMRELEKVIRVCQPDIKIFVGESITGNDCVEQAKEFDKAVGIDAIILAKADVDDKGGAAISVSYILQRPILYLGTGQTYDDLKEFDSKLILESLEL